MLKKAIKYVALVSVMVAMAGVTGELVLAHKGYKLAWRERTRSHIREYADPDVRAIWERCGWGPEVGSRPSAEDSKVVETVWSNGLRECRPQQEKPALFTVGVFGCSYTFGEGVPAEDTFVYRLNTRYPNVCFDNRGMRGTGLVHSYLAMQQAVARGQKYDLVVFDAIGGHFARDQYYHLVGQLRPNEQYVVAPLIHRDWRGRWTITYSNERHWPFEERLLTVDFLQRAYYGLRVELARRAKLGDEKRDNSEYYLPESWKYGMGLMSELAKQNGSDFLCCCLDRSMARHINDLPGIESIIVDAVDTAQARNRVRGIPGYHPNANVNAFWTQEFSKWFDKYLLRKCPEALAGVTEPNTKMKCAWDFASENRNEGARVANSPSAKK